MIGVDGVALGAGAPTPGVGGNMPGVPGGSAGGGPGASARPPRHHHHPPGHIRPDGPNALFLFSPTSPPRRLAIWLSNSWLFEWTIILTILASCCVMAADRKLPNEDRTRLSIEMVRNCT